MATKKTPTSKPKIDWSKLATHLAKDILPPEEGWFSRDEFKEQFGLTERNASRRIASMIDAGVIEMRRFKSERPSRDGKFYPLPHFRIK